MSEKLRHVLKVWPLYFSAVADGTKTFEVRKDDRHFKVGDELLLLEWVHSESLFTGRARLCRVSYKLTADIGSEVNLPMLHKGFCILGLADVRPIGEAG